MTQAQPDGALWWNEGPFLYFGRMGANKGVPEIVDAWLGLVRRLGARCPDLWLVGGAPDEIAAIRRLCDNEALLERLEQRGRIRWWGYLDEAGVSALLLKARALIMHSAYEPGGRVVLEAMAQGVPVIATPHGFARDLIRDWVNGFLVPFGDLPLLRRRLEHFAYQPLLGASLSAAARATADAALGSWDFYQAHADIYAEAALRVNPPPRRCAAKDLDVIRNPLPDGLGGRYPFPPTIPDMDSAHSAACSVLGLSPDAFAVTELTTEGRSLRWRIEAGNCRWIAYHLYSAYSRRALWDRDYQGPLFAHGSDRRSREAEASRLPGFAQLLEDRVACIQLREDMSALEREARGQKWLSAALAPLQRLWQHPPAVDETRLLRESIVDWSRRQEHSPWRGDGNQAAVLRNISLRAAWPETVDKLSRRVIRIGGRLAAAVAELDAIARSFASREEELVPLCLQHGDPGRQTVRVGASGPCLIGGEQVYLGWWGRDPALLLNACGGTRRDSLVRALATLCPMPERRPVVLLWAILEGIFALADARERDAEGIAEPRLRLLIALLKAVSP